MRVCTRQQGCSGVDKALSLDGQRRDLGLTFRQLAGRTGLSAGQAHRGVTDPAHANKGHVRRIRRTLADEARLRRSSDPALLRQVIDRAVPFLRERQRG